MSSAVSCRSVLLPATAPIQLVALIPPPPPSLAAHLNHDSLPSPRSGVTASQLEPAVLQFASLSPFPPSECYPGALLRRRYYDQSRTVCLTRSFAHSLVRCAARLSLQSVCQSVSQSVSQSVCLGRNCWVRPLPLGYLSIRLSGGEVALGLLMGREDRCEPELGLGRLPHAAARGQVCS
ncbi:hypothetical protein B0T26DRAFT_490736 [Lasiosphaeria miniovina]|uniref:Uncharacterized protein n=1 Tax=Lasiosphaeria miniovina TaxID=1954250 RepID=A0AA39ZT10_9PEZI|nr:uncharacterized protein B0T26DRAFT_490736 [Lasiosphaeria miniovina]KAK0703124.1 hypothetical protein B0T26DRAFT_490736 [Lasiosphaeria miniovina]